jgi:formylmethanofuran dehydrogenase subunit B
MSASPSATHPAATPWTCPFCPLLCDHVGVRVDGDALVLAGAECPRAADGLAQASAPRAGLAPRVDGRAASLDEAIAAAARLLGAARQPLFGGLATDVAGARALYRLACATGAISDHAQGDTLMHGLRAQQDRGGFTATLAEVRARAELIVFLGAPPLTLAPLLLDRIGLGDLASVPQRRVVVLGAQPDDTAAMQALAARPGVTVESIALHGDLFASTALLSALVERRHVADAPAPYRALAEALRGARYAVVIGTPARLPAHGALVVETVGRIVNTLNLGTRAAALWIGGGNGAATANQTFAWLSGLPLRSRAGPRGLEHEPVRFAAGRLLADRAVDALLWIASFDGASPPPDTELPLVLLGHPALAARADRPGSVYVPLAIPGIDAPGHLFRTDGVVLMPMFAARASTLPSLGDVVGRIAGALAP